MGKPTKNNRIILFLMGYAHLIISTSIGLGLGFFIGYNSSSDSATSDLQQQQNSHNVIIHRKTYAVDLPWDGKNVLRGKTFTVQPSNAVTSRPVPISTSTASPTTKHSSKSSKMPSSSYTPPPDNIPEIANTTNSTMGIPTPCPTSNNSSITLKPTTLDSIPSQPVPSSSAPATKRPSKGSSKSSKSPSSTPPQDMPEVVGNTTDTLAPTASSTSATNVTSNSPTLKPSLITTSPPTSSDAKTPSPSSSGDVKCTCMPTTSDVVDSTTDSPTVANNTDDQATLSPTVTPAATTLPPTLTAVTTMPSSNATVVDKTCTIVDEETCCTQPATRPEEDKEEVCQKLGCNLNDCSAEEEESVSPTTSPTCNKCEPLEQEVCCDQDASVPTIDQKRVCDKLGCRLSECPSEPTSSPTSPVIETTDDPTPSPSSSSIPTASPSGKPSLFPTRNPSNEPTTSTPSLSTNPTSVPPYFTTLPTDAPTDGPTTPSPSLSSNPSSEPPFFTTLPTKIPTPIEIVQDTLPPTDSTLIPTISTGDIPEESASPSFGSTPTVSKETTGPPTLSIIRGKEVKQLGSNDYKPHFVFTSRIETECTREEDESSGCLVKCIETTKLYEADILINETTNNFLRNCPDGEETDDGGDGTSTSSVVKTIHIPIEIDDHDDADYDDYN